jgi:hypothetical protein
MAEWLLQMREVGTLLAVSHLVIRTANGRMCALPESPATQKSETSLSVRHTRAETGPNLYCRNSEDLLQGN